MGLDDDFTLIRSMDAFKEGAVDFSRFQGCFGPPNRYPTDIDLFADIKGVFLMVEFKRNGARLKTGQRLVLEQHSRQTRVDWFADTGPTMVNRGPNWSMAVWEEDGTPSHVMRWLAGKVCTLSNDTCTCGLCGRISQIVGEPRVTVRSEDDLRKTFAQFTKYANAVRA